VPGLAAETPTTEGVIATLTRETLTGRSVGVQLYPGNPNRLLLDFLRSAGASADPVLSYRYASDAENLAVEAAIRAMAAGDYDAIAFTSSPQLERLQAVAKQRGLEAELREGLTRLRIAAVGPVVAAALEKLGYSIAAMPATSFHLKPLIGALIEALAPKTAG
jgi:uroporphyrinogen-III synthase